ncbi:tripartite tricarboxylate transporter substrate binding protein (plasmid) [Shinella sp. H4-D48]|uniref:Bug family tripartite tricarboxylate transporter substrate binding protein n=1 Tax=Shinella sp. H4-D48 TaxID=2925841 RepID=UPI001F52D9CA|nr:tripartite tricarboxylate transporter substrate binding protein [Shinella sp. H4-D48]UNK39949.1 tripartite tricarboxylate transporter substrate binding protein [Shinella sp. H4-D48]
MKTTLKYALPMLIGLTAAMPAIAADLACKNLRWIVPASAGGGQDWVSRLITDRLAKKLPDVTILVENRGGADGSVAAEALKSAPADGCTVMSISNSQLGAQAVRGAESFGFDLVKDAEPVAKLVSTPYFITAWDSLGVKSLPELIVKAKDAPNSIKFSTSGPASLQSFLYAKLNRQAGIEMIKVNYKGGGDMYADFISGRVPLFLAFPYEVKQYVEDGKAHMLSVSSAKRHPRYPDIPAVSETLPGFDLTQFYGVITRAGAPAQTVDVLSAAIADVLASEDVNKILVTETSYLVETGDREEFRTEIASIIQGFETTATEIGLKK